LIRSEKKVMTKEEQEKKKKKENDEEETRNQVQVPGCTRYAILIPL